MSEHLSDEKLDAIWDYAEELADATRETYDGEQWRFALDVQAVITALRTERAAHQATRAAGFGGGR